MAREKGVLREKGEVGWGGGGGGGGSENVGCGPIVECAEPD